MYRISASELAFKVNRVMTLRMLRLCRDVQVISGMPTDIQKLVVVLSAFEDVAANCFCYPPPGLMTPVGRVRQYEHLATLLPLANAVENQGPISGIMLYSCNRPGAETHVSPIAVSEMAVALGNLP